MRWSAVAKSGAQIIDELNSDVSFWHTGKLPDVSWTAEAGAGADADPVIVGTAASPKCVAGQTILSKQLSVQTSGSADQFVARELGPSLGAILDHAALYGTGVPPQPRGVLSTAGVNSVPIGTNPIWDALGAMRRVCLADDALPDSYGLISSPVIEEIFNFDPPYANRSVSIGFMMPWDFEVSNGMDPYALMGVDFFSSVGVFVQQRTVDFDRGRKPSYIEPLEIRWPQLVPG